MPFPFSSPKPSSSRQAPQPAAERRRTRPAHLRLRRGYSVAEMVIAGSLTALVALGIGSILSFASTMTLQVTLQSDTDQYAVKAMQRMTRDVREASKISILQPYQFRIFYPTLDAQGRYDLTKLDSTDYVEYSRTDASGNLSATGAYIWRKTNTDTVGTQIIGNVQQFSAAFYPANSDQSVQITVEVKKTQSNHTGDTVMSQRVLYLRNYYGNH